MGIMRLSKIIGTINPVAKVNYGQCILNHQPCGKFRLTPEEKGEEFQECCPY